jgi:hypothetical protein
VRFFTGLHQPHDAVHFEASFISVNRLRRRRGPFAVKDWIMDGGGFTEISTFGRYRHDPPEHAAEIRRWEGNGNLLAAVAQDYMCEPWIVAKTGLSVTEHQRLTIERYDQLCAAMQRGRSRMLPCAACGAGRPPTYIMPVLQGYEPAEYVAHLRMYGDRLAQGAWVGVGSVCKRNGDPKAIEAVLLAIHNERPDLRLHGFGLKLTALSSGLVQTLLHTADSMAWSFNARRNGRDANDWREAERWRERISRLAVQLPLFIRRQMLRVA